MNDNRYQLIPQEEAAPRKGPKGIKISIQRVVVVAALVLFLAAAAIYSPVLWGNEPVSAESTLSPAASLQLQLDDTPFALSQEALSQFYEVVAPSVVSIQVETTVASPFSLEGIPSGGQGSGFIYDNNGHIVTNNHVVEDATSITVVFHNGFWADAELVATDPQADLAVLQVTPPENFNWQPLPLADPDSLRVGHTVVALGNPFGLSSTMTTGIVSAMGRDHSVQDSGTNYTYTLPELIQTDAAINPGNSGGPLLNLRGEVVGVNFAIQSRSASNSGVGFSIPASIISRVVPALIEEGVFHYPFLGISGGTINATVAKELGLPNNQLGAYVGDVTQNGPSATAGIVGGAATGQVGDIITAINGESVRSFEELVGYLITQTSPGDTVQLTVLRDGESLNIDVTLAERPGAEVRLTSASNDASGSGSLGQIERLTARDAIDIAIEAVESEAMVTGEIAKKVAAPETVNGVDVWVVELSTESEVVTVTIERSTGEVLDMESAPLE